MNVSSERSSEQWDNVGSAVRRVVSQQLSSHTMPTAAPRQGTARRARARARWAGGEYDQVWSRRHASTPQPMHREGGVISRSVDQLGLPTPRAQFSPRGPRASSLKQLRVRWDPMPLAPAWWLPEDSLPRDVQTCRAPETLARGFGCAGRTNNYLLCWARAMRLHAIEGVPTLLDAFWFSEVP